MDHRPEQREDGLLACPWPFPYASIVVDDQSRTAPPAETADRATNDDAFKLRRTLTFNDSIWEPFYLQKPFLLGMATTFVVMIVALEVLLSFSAKNNGLATVQESWYYSWKFGPTIGERRSS